MARALYPKEWDAMRSKIEAIRKKIAKDRVPDLETWQALCRFETFLTLLEVGCVTEISLEDSCDRYGDHEQREVKTTVNVEDIGSVVKSVRAIYE
jgi:hypothetical protein